jgi:hypothetical protein
VTVDVVVAASCSPRPCRLGLRELVAAAAHGLRLHRRAQPLTEIGASSFNLLRRELWLVRSESWAPTCRRARVPRRRRVH